MKHLLLIFGSIVSVTAILLFASPVSASESEPITATLSWVADDPADGSISPFQPFQSHTIFVDNKNSSLGFKTQNLSIASGGSPIQGTVVFTWDQQTGGYSGGTWVHFNLLLNEDSGGAGDWTITYTATSQVTSTHADEVTGGVCTSGYPGAYDACYQAIFRHYWQVGDQDTGELTVDFVAESHGDPEVPLTINMSIYNRASSADPYAFYTVWWEDDDDAPDDYCPDGTEALTDTVSIAQDSSWTDTISTTYDALKVRYVISRTDPGYIYGTGAVNGKSETFDDDDADTLTVTVPASPYGVQGPVANLEVENLGNEPEDAPEFDLISACIISSSTAISYTYCSPSQTDLLTMPVEMENWQLYTQEDTTEFDEFTLTFWLTEHYAPRARIKVNDGATYLMETDNIYNGSPISWTLPSNYSEIYGGFSGPEVDWEIRNTAWEFTLVSVCISQTRQSAPPAMDCHLYNHDFITSTTGWSDWWDSELSWIDAANTNGAAQFTTGSLFGMMYQDLEEYDNTDLFGPYNVEVRVRSESVSSNTISLQADRVAGGGVEYYERYTKTVGSQWTTISADFYMEYPTNFAINAYDDTLIVDWVCIHDAHPGTDWWFDLPVCAFPNFDDHPAFSITDLLFNNADDNWLWWLAIKIGELFDWLVCMIERLLLMAINTILDVLANLDILELPEIEGLDLNSLIAWLRETFRTFGQWLGDSLANMLLSGRTLGEWLRDQLLTLAEWAWEDIILELITWMMDQAVAAGLIGEDAADRILWMFRNVDLWLAAAADEIDYELQSAMTLLQETLNIFGVLLAGLRSGVTGTDELDMGEELGGFAAYLWRGVEFINEVVEGTPLAGLNVVALGIIFWGLSTWTLRRFGKMLEYLA